MATKRISELEAAPIEDGLYTIGVNAFNESVKIPIGKAMVDFTSEVEEKISGKQDAPTIISQDEYDQMESDGTLAEFLEENPMIYVYES